LNKWKIIEALLNTQNTPDALLNMQDTPETLCSKCKTFQKPY
jgi:hypothetical protein